MNLEDYIKDLPPELQERARACGSAGELLALAREAKTPVPDGALEAVAGGEGGAVGGCFDIECPKCGGTRVKRGSKDSLTSHYRCDDCGYDWYRVDPL